MLFPTLSSRSWFRRPAWLFRLTTWLGGFTRVTVFMSCLCAVSWLFYIRSVSAQLGDRAIQVGRGLESMSEFLGPPTQLRMNGAELFVSSQTSPLPVSAVLDRFAAHCTANSGGVSQQLAQMSAADQAKLPAELKPDRFGVMRRMVNDGEGTSACLAQTGNQGIAGFFRRAGEFVETGDLTRIGSLRYVFARKSGEGSHTILVWSERGFNPQTMFPEGQDAPGRDIPDGVRPPASLRVLHAEVAQANHAIAIYESRESPEGVLQFYRSELAKDGWTSPPLYVKNDQAVEGPGPTRAFVKNGAGIVVYAEASAGRTLVSVVQLGSRGTATAWGDAQ